MSKTTSRLRQGVRRTQYQRCPITGCEFECDHRGVMCRVHWQQAPRKLRKLIGYLFASGRRDTDTYRDMVSQAIDNVQKRQGSE